MKKMPAALTDDERATLKAQLTAARQELLGRERVVAPGGALVPEVGDALDAAGRVSETEELGARNERDTQRLADIEHALGKFEKDEYGLSEESSEPIGFGRLHAIPWARLTVAEEELRAKR